MPRIICIVISPDRPSRPFACGICIARRRVAASMRYIVPVTQRANP